MSYYRLLGLEREPFSTSPDPAFFYQSPGHQAALYRLGVAIRLRRGLSLLLGDVGTGKTTLGRRLYQLFASDPSVQFHVLLNPAYTSDVEFLGALADTFHTWGEGVSPSRLLAALETALFQRGVESRQTLVLLIDEAQKLSDGALEFLRILLNYETNEHKLLQVVLMSQMELRPRLEAIRNLWDRIALTQTLSPFDEPQTRAMVQFRLQQAGYRGRHPLFTDEAIRALHESSLGYPRRIAMLAHDALEYLVMHERRQVDGAVMAALTRRAPYALEPSLA
ncbi:MAG: AAA family ATPase [Candidatus Omnitrophica bacterium]|nr:AAA family ATPase [Candidatus Omnitrophota bacterium]